MQKKYIAYRGQEFTIEWYFTHNQKGDALSYFESLPIDRKKKIAKLIYLLGDMGKIFNTEKFRYEGDQIYALKPSPDRFFCFFFEGSKIIITNAYEKKSTKMPMGEKQKALKAKKDYEKRVKEGIYYE